MKIVVLDGKILNPGDLSWQALEALGSLTVFDDTIYDEDAIIARIADAEIVYTNKTPITEHILQACEQVRFIGILATGYNIVDVEAAKRRRIPVCNVPCYGTQAVAQHTIALLLEICCHVGQHADAVRQGRWHEANTWCFWDSPLTELCGMTLGIIGFGRIGQAVGRIAEALGMRVIVNSRSQNVKGAEYVRLDELLARADIISLHCPLLEETRGIICCESIEKMKDGVILLNTSRGPLVCEQDLADALKSGKIRAAGIDVMQEEPPKKGNPLLSLSNCFITPHIAWAPKQTRARLMDMAVENLRQFLAETPQNVVNL